MALNIKGALEAGYTHTDIVNLLAEEGRYNVDMARKSGFSDSDIISTIQDGPTGGIGEALTGGAKRLLSNTRTAVTAPFGSKESALAGLERQSRITERPGASIEEVKRRYREEGLFPAAKEALSQFPAGLAEQLPNLGEIAAGSRAGAALGMLGGPFAEFTVPAGAILGGIAGPMISSSGSNIERQAAVQQQQGKPIDINLAAAYGGGAAQGALDYASLAIGGVGKLLGIGAKELGTVAAERIAKEKVLPSIIKGTAKTAGAEIPTEVAQQMIERAQAGLSLTTPDAFQEYHEAAYQAALMSPLGGLARRSEVGGARDVLAADQARKDLEQRNIAVNKANEAAKLRAQIVTPEAIPTKDLIEQTTGINRTPATTAKDVRAALNEPSGVRVTDPVTGLERELTVGEYQLMQQPELAPLTSLAPIPSKDVIESFGFKENSPAFKAVEKLDFDNPKSLPKFEKILETNYKKIKEPNQVAIDSFKQQVESYQQAKETPDVIIETTPQGEVAPSVVPSVDGEGLGGGVQVSGRPGVGVTGGPSGLEPGGVGPAGPLVSEPAVRTDGEYATLEVPEAVAPQSTEVMPAAEELMPTVEEGTPVEADIDQEAIRKDAFKVAARLRSQDPYHPALEVLKDPNITPDAVEAARQEIAELEAAAYTPPGKAQPMEEAALAEMPEMEGEDDFAKFESAKDLLGTYVRQKVGGVQNIVPEDQVSFDAAMKALADVMYHLVRQGVKSMGHAVNQARKTLGENAKHISQEQYKEAFVKAQTRHAAEYKKATPTSVPLAESNLFTETAEFIPPDFDKEDNIFNFVKDFDTKSVNRDAISRKFMDLRIKVAYSGAAVQNKLVQEYEGKVQNALTDEVRADILQAIALKSHSLAAEAAVRGKAVIDDIGVTRVEDDPNNLGAMHSLLAKLGAKIGVSQARHAAQAYLVGQRYKSWLELNTAYERRAQVAEGKGNKAEATRLRKRKKLVTEAQQAAIPASEQFAKQYAEVAEIARIYEVVKNNEIDLLEQAGYYSPELAEEYRSTKGYVPLFRVMDDLDDAAPGAKQYFRGFADIGAEKKATGSARQVDDVFDNMMTRHMWAVSVAMRNRANIAQANQLGIVNDKGELIMTTKPVEGKEDVSVPVWINGERNYIQYSDPQLAIALQGLEPAMGPIFNFFAGASRILRMGVTALPPFQLAQVFNDAPRAAMNSGVDHPFQLMGRVLTSFAEIIRNPDDPIAIEMRRLGITGGYEHTAKDTTAKLRRDLGLQANTMMSKVLDKLEHFAAASDLAQRRAVYIQTMKETGNQVLAMDRAVNIINFQKHGSSAKVRALTQVVPFMNAYIQGMDVLYSAMSGTGISGKAKREATMLFVQTAIKLAALSTLYAMMVGDDEEYEKLDDRIKVRSIIIPGTGVKIPVAGDVAMLVKAIPELTYQYIIREGTDNPMDATNLFKGISDSIKDGLLGPNPMPQALRAGFEVAVNKDFLTGSPIVGRGLEQRETEYQYTENTSRLARLIGSTGIISPMNADHLIKGYGGTVASLFLYTTDGLVNQVADEKLPTTPLYKVPSIGSFMYSPMGKDHLTDYYDLKDRSDEITATLNYLKKTGTSEEVREFAEENKQMLSVRNRVNTISENMKKLRETRNGIINSGLSAADKRDRIDAIDEQIQNSVRQINLIRVRAGL